MTEQLAEGPAPLSVQGLPVKLPAPLEEKLTEPVGVIGVPGLVSATVAVHVVEPFTGTAFGLQLTLVEVVRVLTVIVVVPVLVAWLVSPE